MKMKMTVEDISKLSIALRIGLAIRILKRHANIDIPEQKLMFAILEEGIRDINAKSGDKSKKAQIRVIRIQQEARRFFTKGIFKPVADMVDLQHEFVIWVLRKVDLI